MGEQVRHRGMGRSQRNQSSKWSNTNNKGQIDMTERQTEETYRQTDEHFDRQADWKINTDRQTCKTKSEAMIHTRKGYMCFIKLGLNSFFE